MARRRLTVIRLLCRKIFRRYERRPIARFVAVLIAAACFIEPAAADRHCSPVLDYYYQARHEILASSDTCQADLSRAVLQLEESEIGARNCGCTVLQARLQALLERIKIENDNDDRACKARSALVLEFAGQAYDAYKECL